MRVIVADDSATARMILIRCLKIAGLTDAEFVEAEDGRQALGLAKSDPAHLMVTDLNMPNMDGEELLTNLAFEGLLEEMDVVIITSAKNAARESELMELGALSVLGKPVSPANIARILSHYIKKEQGATPW